MSRYSKPEPIAAYHEVDGFSCGSPSLDSWLRRRAFKNEASGASRTFVTTLSGSAKVVGYYALAASAVEIEVAPGAIRRNIPDPIPVVLLGRLAVDRRHQAHGLGVSLLRDAILRAGNAAGSVGVRALLAHAIDDDAAAFYRHFGFRPSPFDDRTLFLPISAIETAAREAGR